MLLDFSSCTLGNLKSFVQEHHYPAYRASQIHQWILKGVTDPNQMTNLPKDLIEVLNDSFQNQSIRMERKLVSGNRWDSEIPPGDYRTIISSKVF